MSDQRQAATTPGSDEAVSALRRGLLDARDLLTRVRPYLRLFDDLEVWWGEHEIQVRDMPEPVAGSTAPCSVCGEQIDGVPMPGALSLRIAQPHDHFTQVDVRLRTSRSKPGAVCGRCVTSALLVLLIREGSWVDETYFSALDSGHAETPPEPEQSGSSGGAA